MLAMRDTIRFMLGSEIRELIAPDPTMTVLQYLRREAGRSGTKEGCAEGDCGACTVVLGERHGQTMRYRAVNACIQFLPQLDGKQLITVEDLSRDGDALHPVQQAMVEHHGSQCGFCTPGFVMSMFALHHDDGRTGPCDDDEIEAALAGNLCRCTGYGPIIEAARSGCGQDPTDHFAREERMTVTTLRKISGNSAVGYERHDRRYFAPVTLDELCGLAVKNSDAHIISGVSDVGLWVTKQHRALQTVISIGNVAELKTLKRRRDHIEIGAGVTISAAEPMLAENYPGLAPLVRRFASRQIRNVATIGGNIANGSPIGDMPPALIALGTELQLRKGKRARSLPLEDFFIKYGRQDRAPGEIVTGVRIPRLSKHDRYRCYKLSKRFDQDISSVLGAFWLRLDGDMVADIRIAFGGMAGVPQRAHAAEQILVGSRWDDADINRAAAALEKDFAPLTDMRGSARYRMIAARNLVRKFHLETTGDAVGDLYGSRGQSHV